VRLPDVTNLNSSESNIKLNFKKAHFAKAFSTIKEKLVIHPREANQLIIIRHTSFVLTLCINTQGAAQLRIPLRNQSTLYLGGE